MAKASASRNAPSVFDDANDRRQEILGVASVLFARRGYDGVSVRQIAVAAGILGGSLYHHFSSKRALYIEVHRQALSRNAARIEDAIADLTDPWDRLRVASETHLALQIDPESISMPMMSDPSAMTSDMRKELVKDRDRFETIYKRLVADLPLNPKIDRDLYRVCLVSLLNAVATWYRPGRLSAEAIAEQITLIFRNSSAAVKDQSRPKRTLAAPAKAPLAKARKG